MITECARAAHPRVRVCVSTCVLIRENVACCCWSLEWEHVCARVCVCVCLLIREIMACSRWSLEWAHACVFEWAHACVRICVCDKGECGVQPLVFGVGTLQHDMAEAVHEPSTHDDL